MLNKIREWLSVQKVKHSRLLLFLGIIMVNVAFVILMAILMRVVTPDQSESKSIWQSIFYTITMIMDAGCIEFFVDNVHGVDLITGLICLIIIFSGMLIFTGALIGFLTNIIDHIIEYFSVGKGKLRLSDHTIMLNWNTRASEIINDLLFSPDKQKVVVLVDSGKEKIESEIAERLADTVTRENRKIAEIAKKRFGSGLKSFFYRRKNKFRGKVTVIVREGDVFSTKQLEDLCIKKAHSVIILGSDVSNAACKFETREKLADRKKGNPLTVKTLMQVADLTNAQDSASEQVIVVEITDPWTLSLVDSITHLKTATDAKEDKKQKARIVPLRVNIVLGQLLSQFSLMPELNMVYNCLFSNKGAAFYSHELSDDYDQNLFVSETFDNNVRCIPLSTLKVKDNKGEEKNYGYYVADNDKDYYKNGGDTELSQIAVKLDPEYHATDKNVIILGHNSRMHELVEGFASYMSEWQSSGETLTITVIDDSESLKKKDEYDELIKKANIDPDKFIARSYATDRTEEGEEDGETQRRRVAAEIRRIIDAVDTDTSVLILSDDNVPAGDIDSDALTNLVYIQDIIKAKKAEDKNFNEESIDVIVEIIDPKHYDVVENYGKNNVVISNRYISKMITQISSDFPLYSFYEDILKYDDIVSDPEDKSTNPAETNEATSGETDNEDNKTDKPQKLKSKEIYLKEADRFFLKGHIPPKCLPGELIRAVWTQSTDPSVFKDQINPTLVLGYYRAREGMTLFAGEKMREPVELRAADKLIVYSLH